MFFSATYSELLYSPWKHSFPFLEMNLSTTFKLTILQFQKVILKVYKFGSLFLLPDRKPWLSETRMGALGYPDTGFTLSEPFLSFLCTGVIVQLFIYSPCIHSFCSFIYSFNVYTLSTNIIRGPHENSIYTFTVVVFWWCQHLISFLGKAMACTFFHKCPIPPPPPPC